jgi:hypothetical protein
MLKRPSRSHARVQHTPLPPPEVARETRCRFCGQDLYWDPNDGHFECGGDGEGACTFWNVISDYDRAGRPANIDKWLDGWIQEAVGTSWTAMGWSRAKHAKAIRDYFGGTSRSHSTVKTEAGFTTEEWQRLVYAALQEAALARRVAPTTAARWEKIAKTSRAALDSNDWYWLARAAAHQERKVRREGNEAEAAEWEALVDKAEAAAA